MRPALPVMLLLWACAPDHGRGQRSPSSDTQPGDSQASVLAALRSYYTDFSARNWDAFAEHFWPGATLTTIWQPPGEPAPRVVSTTVPAFVEQAPAGPGSKPIFEERLMGADIRVHRNLAQAWARYTVLFGDTGSVATWRGMDALTLIWHDGRWKIAALAYTDE
jgi:hypothetical protein